MHLKALLGDGLFHSVGLLEHLLLLHPSAPGDEQELPCGGELRLCPIQHLKVCFQQGAHLRILLLIQSAGQEVLVVLKGVIGIRADDLQLRQSGKHHHQVVDLLLHVGMG